MEGIILYLFFAFIVVGGLALVLACFYICIAMVNDIREEWRDLRG